MADIKISATTLGCPGWDLDTVLDRYVEYGFDAVDFRGLNGVIDITTLPEFTSGLPDTRMKIEDHGLVTTAVNTSISICVPEKLDQNLEEARRNIEVAVGLNASDIRVFGNGNIKEKSREELVKIAADTMHRIMDLDGATQLQWAFETHDHWSSGVLTKTILDAVDLENFGALWDVGHTPRLSDESPQETFDILKGRIFNTHFKDAIYDPSHPQAMKDGWRYTFLGEGEVPLVEAVKILKDNGYEGCLTLEHEKHWHPELAEPEEAFPQAADWFRKQLGR